MKRFTLLACSGLLGAGIVSLLALTRIATAQSDDLIVPGERVGPIGLGMYREQVGKSLGKPNSSNFEGRAFDKYKYPKNKDRLPTWLNIWYSDPPYRVCSIDIHNLQRYKTQKNIRAGSSILDVFREYGSPDEKRCPGTYSCIAWYDREGIIFVFDPRDNYVYEISIGKCR